MRRYIAKCPPEIGLFASLHRTADMESVSRCQDDMIFYHEILAFRPNRRGHFLYTVSVVISRLSTAGP